MPAVIAGLHFGQRIVDPNGIGVVMPDGMHLQCPRQTICRLRELPRRFAGLGSAQRRAGTRTPMSNDRPVFRYAGFLSRLGAMLIDMVIYIPAVVVGTWASFHSQAMALLLEIPLTFALVFYNVYFIGRWGQTLGKMALRIKVVSLDGTDAGYRRAVRRHGVDLVLSLISTVIRVQTFLSFSASDYDGLTDRQKLEFYHAHLPAWADALTMLSYVWVASELMVLLFNEKRRALHDYLGGTMVIHTGKPPAGKRQA